MYGWGSCWPIWDFWAKTKPSAAFGLFYLIGLLILWYGIWSARRSSQAAYWPTTQCSLTNLVLEETKDEGTSYEVRVEYAYNVAGCEYRGARLAFGYGGSSGYKAHAEIYEKLKAAQFVVVRFNPNNPAMSSLSFGINRSIRIILTFAITWLTYMLWVTFGIWWFFPLWFVGSFWAICLLFRSDRVLLRNLSVE